MSLKLYFHPLASFCWKVLIALYENDTPFEPHIVDLGDERSSTEFKKIWPIGKFPVLHDEARNVTVPESSIIIEYLSHHYPGGTELVPKDPDLALQARQWDRVYDFYVHEPMQKIVGDRLRPPGKTDAPGVEQAKALLKIAYKMVDGEMAAKPGRSEINSPWPIVRQHLPFFTRTRCCLSLSATEMSRDISTAC